MDLTAREYKKNMQWLNKPVNKIDTVQLSPISNEESEETASIATTEVKSGKLDNASSNTNFPIPNSYVPKYIRSMRCIRTYTFEDHELGKSRVEIVMASGSVDITTDKAIVGTPYATVKMNGKSYVVPRGVKDYNYTSNGSALKDMTKSFTQEIIDKKVETHETLSWRYGENSVNFLAWVYEQKSSDALNNFPPYYIATTWDKYYSPSRATPYFGGWSTFESEEIKKLPATSFNAFLNYTPGVIPLKNTQFEITTQVQKLSDYKYRVFWQAPVRYLYIAAARSYGIFQGYLNIDSYAFVDIVDSLTISLYAKSLATDKVDLAYSLSGPGTTALSTQLRNQFPLKIDEAECFTMSTVAQAPSFLNWGSFQNNDVRQGYYRNASAQLVTNSKYMCNSYAIGFASEGKYDPILKITVLEHVIYQSDWDTVPALVLLDSEGKVVRTIKYTATSRAKVYEFSASEGITSFYINTASLYTEVSIVTNSWQLWYKGIAITLLTKYENGKYIVTADAKASWCFNNNVHVGTQMYIHLLNGKIISNKEGNPVLFEVKNIEKKFMSSEFIYQLKLMEV